MSFYAAFAALSAAIAAISLIAIITATFASRAEMRRQEHILAEVNFESAVKASDIGRLGELLEVRLGSVPIAEYSRNSIIRAKFRTTLTDIARFVEDVQAEAEADPGELGASGKERFGPPRSKLHDSELIHARASVLRGEVWNGLARARRRLEMKLLQMAEAHGADVGENRGGTGLLIELLTAIEVIDAPAKRELLDALQVASRGIHGLDIDVNQALAAIGTIDQFLLRNGGTIVGRGRRSPTI